LSGNMAENAERCTLVVPFVRLLRDGKTATVVLVCLVEFSYDLKCIPLIVQ